MQIYLPIAEISMNLFVLLAMGAAVGFLSGLVGIGGGFLMTPLLIFSGVPTPVAVGTEANQIVATSASGALAQWRRGNVDIKMGLVMLTGGIVGSAAGVEAIKILRQIGQVDLIIAVCYVVFLGSIGTLMLIESLNAWRKAVSGQPVPTRRTGQHNWIHRLPLKQRPNTVFMSQERTKDSFSVFSTHSPGRPLQMRSVHFRGHRGGVIT